ncbi:MAG: hypothetical protein HYV07_01825 [Deltaproteobacteria bacterium]|nr:hypothetical protein [Deltaproteobacteria bacterium]
MASIALVGVVACPDEPVDPPSGDCPPATDCTADGLECGAIMERGACVRNCGECTAPHETCGALAPNQCDCRPVTCERLGYECGEVEEICSGATVPCGDCAEGFECGGAGVAGACGRVVSTGQGCDERSVCGRGDACCGKTRMTCQPAPTGICPPLRPDLTVDQAEIRATLTILNRQLADQDCVVRHGCVDGTGLRRLLAFSTMTRNEGDADFILGNPNQDPEAFVLFECNNTLQYEHFAVYRLVDDHGAIVRQQAAKSFCLGDMGRFDTISPEIRPEAFYGCDLGDSTNGLSRGWFDVYDSSVECQWIDVTGVPSGEYRLEVEVNPNREVPESTFLNNVATASVTL